MKIDDLSIEAQEGLRKWSEAVWGDPMTLEDQGGASATWAWACFLLRESEDRAEWFLKGKWATLQVIEMKLLEEARAELPDGVRKKMNL